MSFDTSWLDDYSAYAAPDNQYYGAPEQPYQAPEPVYQPYQSVPQYDPTMDPTYYDQPQEVAPAWYETVGNVAADAGKGLWDYAKANPKDAIGMGIGAATGLAGLFMGNNKQEAPNLSGVNQANAMMQQQLQSTQGLNADAVAKLRAQIGGDYGDYADASGARSGATAKVNALLASGPDYALLPEEQAQLAELDQKWAAKGMLGSSLHNAEKQQLQSTFTNNALARYQSQLKALQDTAQTFSNQTSQQFQNTGNVVNQGETRQIQGLSNLAASGLQGAQLKANVDQGNTKIENDRANQLLKFGGDIFGRSIADPAGQVKKEENSYKKNTGYTS